MRDRGKLYWDWANPELHFRNFDERLACGTLINIQVRLSQENTTQLFLGVYGKKGIMLLEEHYPDCRGQTMSAAMDWALQRAKEWVIITFPPDPEKGPEPLPRRGSRKHR